MNNLRKLSSLTLILLTTAMLVFTGCSSDKITIPDEYNYDDLSEYINVCDYNSFKYGEGEFVVSDEDVQAYIDDELKSSEQTVKKDSGTVTDDCIANIDYVGSMNGKEFDGGAGEGYDLDIANSTFIEGFAEALVGHSVGETFDINVNFPDDYGSEDLAGKPAVFKITVNYISVKVPAELTDEWVQTNTAFKTVDEYQSNIQDSLIKQKYLRLIVDASEVVKYPDAELDANEEACKSYYGDSVDESKIKEVAEQTTKQELVLHQISRLEKLELTDEGFNEYIDKLLSDANLDKKTFEENAGISLADYVAQNEVFNSYLYQNVMDKLINYVK